MLLNEIIPSCSELLRVLKEKRRRRRGKINREFPSDDENIIYIVILKIQESYHLEFTDSHLEDSPGKISTYQKYFLPLAIELYKHHVNSSDLILLNSLLRCGNQFTPGRKLNPSLLSHFSNLNSKYSAHFIDCGHLMLEKEDYLRHFKHEKMKLQTK